MIVADPQVREVPDLLPARMLNAFVYCPRLFFLEWVQKEWAPNAETIAGTRDHRRVDVTSGRLPAPEELTAGERVEARGITLEAPEAGLIAKLDLVESQGEGLVPVDTKHGRGPEDGLWDSDKVQLGAQALVLRENGYRVEEVAVFYKATRQRVSMPLTEDLIAFTRSKAAEARLAAAQWTAPPPPRLSERCPRCSLVGICLPDESALLAAPGDAKDLDEAEESEVRRLFPARDDAVPVYVQAQGGRVGKKDEGLEIWEREVGKRRVRMIDISQVSLFGNVTMTAGAYAVLLGSGIPICHFSYGGWFYGVTLPLGSPNVFQRIAQHRVFEDPVRSLELARGVVERKIRNSRTLLMRNAKELPARVVRDLKADALAAREADSPERLLGIEGMAARRYFESFPLMMAGRGEVVGFDFATRNRRPPRDPINALLSFAYSILAKDWTITLFAVGLDPHHGFFHRCRFGRPALALDLMEEFRPLIADSVVLQLVNNGEIRPSDFIERGDAVALKTDGRKRFFLAYERRMNQLITHPVFGYTISYRRVLEVQARLLSRHLVGELPEYPGFTTR